MRNKIGLALVLCLGAGRLEGASSAFVQPLQTTSPATVRTRGHPCDQHQHLLRTRTSGVALDLGAGAGDGRGTSGWDGGGGRGDSGLPSRVDLGLHWDGSSQPSLSRSKIFITGATGCIGRKLVAALLLTTKHDLICLVRSPARLQLPLACRQQARKRLQLIVGDLKDKSSYAKAAASADHVVLLACSWGGEDCFRVNVESIADTISVLRPSAQVIYFSSASALTSQGNLRFVHADASSASRDYLRTKAAALRFLLSSPKLQPRLTVLYPSLVVGPRSSAFASLIQETLVPALLGLPFLSPALHYIRAADAAAVTKLLLNQPALGRRHGGVPYEPRTLPGARTSVMVPAGAAGKSHLRDGGARHLVLARPAWTSAWLRALGSLLGGSFGAFLGVTGAPSDVLLAAWSARVWAGAGVVAGCATCVSIPAAMVNALLAVTADGARSAPSQHFASAVSSQTFKALRSEALEQA